MAWFQDVDGNVFWEEEPQGSPSRSNPSLQDASKITGIKRGSLFAVPAGTTGGPIPGAVPLRLEAGTWAITAFRVDNGPAGLGPAASPPNAADLTRWPFGVFLSHGVGAATWSELVRFAARGTTFVRAGDWLEMQVFKDGGTPTSEALGIVLAATQLIVPVTTSITSTEADADGQGLAVHAVPPGAVSFQYIGLAPTAIRFDDSTGATLCVSGPPGLNVVRVPLNAATLNIGTIAAGTPTSVQWEVAL